MDNINDLKGIVNFLESAYNIIEGHDISKIPFQSVLELHLLKSAQLLESSDDDVHKFFNFIDDALMDANKVRGILPVYHKKFTQRLNERIEEEKFVEIIVSKKVLRKYNVKSNVKYISSFRGVKNFLLIVTDEIMVLGFFKNDGNFDQNRLIASTNIDSIKWAENLFKYFKRINK